mgnify:CR=1 FL=1
MARCRKERQICLEVPCRCFRTETEALPVELQLEELETLRLVDLENFDQSTAAERMGISRGTLQRILYQAHRKVARALVFGQTIVIAEQAAVNRPAACRRQQRCRHCCCTTTIMEDQSMIIAVTCQDNQVFQHFGHTPAFAVYEVADGKVVQKQLLSTGDSGHGALAGVLADRGVKVLLCGGIGAGAQQMLAAAGIKLVGGVSGDVDAALEAYLNGTLAADPNFSCQHHHHDGEAEHEHHCHCGNH